MQRYRRKKLLKDQVSLAMMLEEQQKRGERQNSMDSSSGIGGEVKAEEEVKPQCEIVIMKQNKKLIQFPELENIRNRATEILKQRNKLSGPASINTEEIVHREELMQKRPEYPTLVHFRNSAHVMKKIEDQNLQLYVEDILGLDIDQKDELGILNKMIMDKEEK